ncbi:hypothetical protein U0070_006371 [Myodes glareolus]|uniref:Olfactory receptor n=1 Tax=Myodes glareolus TaxID=447135 RepID=A0AAW0I043_MYOGA
MGGKMCCDVTAFYEHPVLGFFLSSIRSGQSRFLGSIITKVKSISYNNCLAQLFFFISMGVSEFFLLTAMSYDRYVAICKPLHYTVIMSQKVCALLVLTSWLAGFLTIFPPLMLVLKLDFCASNVIDHFSCDYFPILQLSCSDTRSLEMIGFYFAFVTLLFTLALVILSYICIINTILRFPSASQRKKAFSTCSSHMIVISISYGSCIFMYVKPSANERASLTKGVAVLNTSIAPMLNPFIYTLRNQQAPGGTILKSKIKYSSSNDTIKKKQTGIKHKFQEVRRKRQALPTVNPPFHQDKRISHLLQPVAAGVPSSPSANNR